MPCNTCSFYSFPRSECRLNPPAAGFGFAKADELDWCAKHERDRSMSEARRLLELRNHPSENVMVKGSMTTVFGAPLTDEELAENKEKADKLIAARRKG